MRETQTAPSIAPWNSWQNGNDKIDAFVSLESTSGTAIGETMKRLHITGRTIIAMDVDPNTLG